VAVIGFGTFRVGNRKAGMGRELKKS